MPTNLPWLMPTRMTLPGKMFCTYNESRRMTPTSDCHHRRGTSSSYAASIPPEVSSLPNSFGVILITIVLDVVDFQTALLGEYVPLDISSVRSIRCNKRKKTLEVSSCRVQIWHEDRSSPYMQSDSMSFITNATRLAGRPMENTRPRSARVVIFLGRSEEYITFLSKFAGPHGYALSR